MASLNKFVLFVFALLAASISTANAGILAYAACQAACATACTTCSGGLGFAPCYAGCQSGCAYFGTVVAVCPIPVLC